jgi:protein gp37
MAATTIEWADRSWNPGVYGCAEVSPACAHCYAARMAHRLVGAGVYPDGITEKRASGVHWSGVVKTAELEQVSRSALAELPKKKAGRVFVTSMSDVFLDEVDDDFLIRLFAEMALRPHLTFMVLTKRPERALRFFRTWMVDESVQGEAEHVARTYMGLPHFAWDSVSENELQSWAPHTEKGKRLRQRRAWPGWPLPNVWLGCTVEDQARAEERIPVLLQLPAVVRFLSCEPLLGPLRILGHLMQGPRVADCASCGGGHGFTRCPNTGGVAKVRDLRGGGKCTNFVRAPGPQGGIHWVITGGESGHGARPSHPDWFRSLRDQCVGAGVPFLFKQWGEWMADYEGAMHCGECKSGKADAVVTGDTCGWCGALDWQPPPHHEQVKGSVRLGKANTGRGLDGRTWDEFPVGVHRG